MKKNSLLIYLTILLATTATNANNAEVKEMLKKVAPKTEVKSINKTDLENILEVELENNEYIYVTDDSKHIISGPLFSIKKSEMTNLTEKRISKKRQSIIKDFDKEDLITFQGNGKKKKEIFVFTDTTCGYCKKLHHGIEDINELGITVHYLAFPRSGPRSETALLMEKVWCAPDRHKALKNAKERGSVERKTEPCDSPVIEQYITGLEMGITGTPGIFDAEGRNLGGYLTPKQIEEKLSQHDI